MRRGTSGMDPSRLASCSCACHAWTPHCKYEVCPLVVKGDPAPSTPLAVGQPQDKVGEVVLAPLIVQLLGIQRVLLRLQRQVRLDNATEVVVELCAALGPAHLGLLDGLEHCGRGGAEGLMSFRSVGSNLEHPRVATRGISSKAKGLKAKREN